MSKLPSKINGFSLQSFAKPHLVVFLLYTIVFTIIFDAYKTGLVHTFLFRFFKICSSMENFHIKVEHLRSIFKCNNYPANIIDECIKIFFEDVCINRLAIITTMQYCIKVIFQPENRLSTLFKFKDSIPFHLHSHLIYKFKCSNCNITYYGETKRHHKVRVGEHISTSPLTEKRINNNKRSSVKDHCFLSGHVCSFDDFKCKRIFTY